MCCISYHESSILSFYRLQRGFVDWILMMKPVQHHADIKIFKTMAALWEKNTIASSQAHAEVPTAKRWQRREVKSVSPVAPVAPVPSVKHSSMDGYRPSSMEPADPDRGSDPLPQKAPKHKPSDKCPICLEGFSAPGDMPRTCRKCNNNFHQACLSEWAKKEQQIKWEQKPWMLPSQFESGTCPCCRSAKGHDRSRRWKK